MIPFIIHTNLGAFYTDSRSTVPQGKSSKAKVFLSDGTDYPYTGSCVFFLRSNPTEAISSANVAKEVLFGSLSSKRDEMLGAIEKLLTHTFIPALANQSFSNEAPDLPDYKKGNANGDSVKQEFLGMLSY